MSQKTKPKIEDIGIVLIENLKKGTQPEGLQKKLLEQTKNWYTSQGNKKAEKFAIIRKTFRSNCNSHNWTRRCQQIKATLANVINAIAENERSIRDATDRTLAEISHDTDQASDIYTPVYIQNYFPQYSQ